MDKWDKLKKINKMGNQFVGTHEDEVIKELNPIEIFKTDLIQKKN